MNPTTTLRNYLACLLLLAAPVAQAQLPNWQATLALGSTGSSNSVSATSTTVNGNGDLYVTGYFVGSAVFGSTTLTGPASRNSLFVAKWSRGLAGFEWAVQAGGPGNVVPTTVAVSNTGVYVSGTYSGPTATFGPVTLTNAGSSSVFVAKLTDAGSSTTFKWAQQVGGSADAQYSTTNLAVANGNLYLSGGFTAATLTIGTTTLTNPGSSSVFVAKLTDAGSTGSFGWAVAGGGSATEDVRGLAASGTSVYLTGVFRTSSLPDGTRFGSTVLQGRGDLDMFVAKLTDAGSTGSFAWAQSIGGPGDDAGQAVAVNGASVYLAGTSRSAYLEMNGSQLPYGTAGDFDVLLARLTDTGNTASLGWVQQAGGSGPDYPTALAVYHERVYVTGNFSGTANFGLSTVTSAGGTDVFVSALQDYGFHSSFFWAQQGGGSADDAGTTLTVVPGVLVPFVYVAGRFNGTAATFNKTTLAAPSATSYTGFLGAIPDVLLLAQTPATLPGLDLYPNPARTAATVRLPAGTGPATLTLLDALGRVTRTAAAPAGTAYPLDLTGQAPGMYALRVQADGKQAVQKLVIE